MVAYNTVRDRRKPVPYSRMCYLMCYLWFSTKVLRE